MNAHSLRTKCNLVKGTHAESAGFQRRYYAVKIISRRCGTPWALNRNICCRATWKASNRHSSISRKKKGVPDSAVGGRGGCVVPPSRCQLPPVRKVPGWSALGFPFGLWVAPERYPGADAETEAAGEGEKSPCFPGVYVLLWLPRWLCLPL